MIQWLLKKLRSKQEIQNDLQKNYDSAEALVEVQKWENDHPVDTSEIVHKKRDT